MYKVSSSLIPFYRWGNWGTEELTMDVQLGFQLRLLQSEQHRIQRRICWRSRARGKRGETPDSTRPGTLSSATSKPVYRWPLFQKTLAARGAPPSSGCLLACFKTRWVLLKHREIMARPCGKTRLAGRVKYWLPGLSSEAFPIRPLLLVSFLTAFLVFKTPHFPSVPFPLAESSMAPQLPDGCSHQVKPPCGGLSLQRSMSPLGLCRIITDKTNTRT